MTLAMEKKEWKPFRNALCKSDRKNFDDMWDIPRLYASACSNSCQLVPLQPIIMSILFHHYKELLQCIREVEELGAKVNVKENVIYSTINEQEEPVSGSNEPVTTTITTLDGFLRRK